jgi:hypothetical protein
MCVRMCDILVVNKHANTNTSKEGSCADTQNRNLGHFSPGRTATADTSAPAEPQRRTLQPRQNRVGRGETTELRTRPTCRTAWVEARRRNLGHYPAAEPQARWSCIRTHSSINRNSGCAVLPATSCPSRGSASDKSQSCRWQNRAAKSKSTDRTARQRRKAKSGSASEKRNLHCRKLEHPAGCSSLCTLGPVLRGAEPQNSRMRFCATGATGEAVRRWRAIDVGSARLRPDTGTTPHTCLAAHVSNYTRPATTCLPLGCFLACSVVCLFKMTNDNILDRSVVDSQSTINNNDKLTTIKEDNKATPAVTAHRGGSAPSRRAAPGARGRRARAT